MLSFSVSQRLRGFGVRLTLGATPLAVSSVVLVEGLRLSLAGVALGLLAAGAVVRSVSAILYGTQASDLRQYAIAAVVVLACSAFAFWLPARRAAGLDPLAVLRAE